MTVLWSANLQMASEMTDAFTYAVHAYFMASFCRLLNYESPYCIGPPFGAKMVHMYCSLKYRRFLMISPPLSSVSIIWWSVDTVSSLMQTLYKSLWYRLTCMVLCLFIYTTINHTLTVFWDIQLFKWTHKGYKEATMVKLGGLTHKELLKDKISIVIMHHMYQLWAQFLLVVS